MTFEERQAAIGNLLREQILVRKQRPERFDDDTARAEIRDMVDDLNSAWPIMPREMFEATGANLARELRAMHAGRDWPPIATMLKALKAATTAKPKYGGADEEPQHVYDGVVAWVKRFPDRCPFARAHHSARLVADGHATWGQLRRAGFWIPDEHIAEAKAEPDPDHPALLADIIAMGERIKANHAGHGAFSATPDKRWTKYGAGHPE